MLITRGSLLIRFGCDPIAFVNNVKVMAHCTVGYLFEGAPENGGKGFLIGCHRCASFKVPLCDICYSSRDPDTGKLKFKGNAVKHSKGIPYLVDCNTTGSDPGTPSSPLFPLQSLWEHFLISAIENLVAPVGPCHGAQVVFQEDNAGPHNEGTYPEWMQVEFSKKKWIIELQAPQGVYLKTVCSFMTVINSM